MNVSLFYSCWAATDKKSLLFWVPLPYTHLPISNNRHNDVRRQVSECPWGEQARVLSSPVEMAFAYLEGFINNLEHVWRGGGGVDFLTHRSGTRLTHTHPPLQRRVFMIRTDPSVRVKLLAAQGIHTKISLCSLDPSSRKRYPCCFPQDALWHHPHWIVFPFVFKHWLHSKGCPKPTSPPTDGVISQLETFLSMKRQRPISSHWQHSPAPPPQLWISFGLFPCWHFLLVWWGGIILVDNHWHSCILVCTSRTDLICKVGSYISGKLENNHRC